MLDSELDKPVSSGGLCLLYCRLQELRIGHAREPVPLAAVICERFVAGVVFVLDLDLLRVVLEP